MKETAKLFKALSDPNRLRILKMLEKRTLCVCEITDVLNLATSTVSKHLSILKESELIVEEKNGKWVDYSLNTTTENKRVKEFLNNLDLWIVDEQIVKIDYIAACCVDRNLVCCK
ncbi:MAG: winged helix-turn-helix transcriptional regulator [Ignavibacteriaceae bacterium]|nr:winged helix-turn-helix transcriptional regulator [Ignavibacteriaceae bacterium]